ncbi:helix-turn-helix domain-containing protein [Streptomyces xiamenensis]
MLPTTVLDSRHLPPHDRFEYWRQNLISLIAPMEITSDITTDFQGRSRLITLEDIRVLPITMRAVEARRTPRLIRHSDPELLHIALPTPGASPLVVSQNGGQHVTGPGELYLVDTSRPFTVGATAPDLPFGGDCVEIPKSRLSLPPNTPTGEILGHALSSRHGFGALLAHYVTHLRQQYRTYRPADVPRLATTLADLVTGLITHTLDTAPPQDEESAERVLLLTVKAFIERHLTDPGLKPAVVAAQHHVSLRQLHRIFQRQGTTPAAHIRRRRLERAHAELTDPVHARVTVHAIARRWGFASPAHFTRAYTQQYGGSPGRTRRRVLDRQCPGS